MDPLFTGTQYTNPRYLLGSDELGRDILSRLIWSARVSMVVGFIPTALTFAIGLSLGMLAGFYGGWVDNLLMRFTDIVYAFPDLLFLIIIMAALRNTALGEVLGGLMLMFLALAIVSWVGLARLIRGQVLSLKEKEFVEAAKSSGATNKRIIFNHILPNTLGPITVNVTLGVAAAILTESALSFLGFGVQPPVPTWGNLLNEAQPMTQVSPYLTWFPGLFILLTVLCVNFLGDGLRDALDPHQKIGVAV